jgi:hypothetical protein
MSDCNHVVLIAKYIFVYFISFQKSAQISLFLVVDVVVVVVVVVDVVLTQ